MTNTKETGTRGENLALELLTGKGYAIIDRNVRIGNVEIDILAMHGNRIVVVEVKTRRDDHLDPNFGIDRAKLLRLCRAGSNYVKIKNLPHEVQIDVILITETPDGTTSAIDHIEDIALPPMRRRR